MSAGTKNLLQNAWSNKFDKFQNSQVLRYDCMEFWKGLKYYGYGENSSSFVFLLSFYGLQIWDKEKCLCESYRKESYRKEIVALL